MASDYNSNDPIKVNTSAVSVINPQDEDKNAKNSSNLPSDESLIRAAIIESAKASGDIKSVIDLAATSKALENEQTVDKLVKEKTDELKADAEAKKTQSEINKIREEAEKVRQETQREIAKLEGEKDALTADVERLKTLDNKAEAFFNANKSILRCIGVREKLSLKVMMGLMAPATALFIFFQILLLPLSLIGFIVEAITGIVGAISGGIAKNGWKIFVAILSTALIAALVVGIYWLVIKFAII